MDRSHGELVEGFPSETEDVRYWAGRTIEERFAHIELLRQINYGYDPATARLERVLELAWLE